MSDDNNQKSRGPRKSGTGGRGGGRDGGKGGGFGRGGASGGERKPFRGRADPGERPARRFDKPSGPRDGAARPPREGGERPFRARPDGERPARRPSREGAGPRSRSFGDRERNEGKRFERPRSDRPERSRGGDERPRRLREDNAVARPKILASLPAQEPERIAKVMARAGVASRRDSEAMIAEGRVSVNGKVLESPALDIGPSDVVLVDGEPLPARERTRLWLYHKPRGLVTTNHDPEGRPTVFEALPEDLPRVLSIGRLDINTEGLLLLTNDGGLARMLELPETGWLRRYRVRAFGSVTQDKLDTLKDGVTIEGISYGPVIARFERQQGSNTWLTVDLREGKNREVKTVLEHLGLDVNRLIRVSFGPFQLGDLPEGEVDEVRSRVLKDQLGEELMAKAGVDFEAPRRDEMPEPIGARRAAPGGDDRPRRRGGSDSRKPEHEMRGDKPWTRTVWRDEDAQPQRERKAPPRRGADPKAERQAREASGEIRRTRDKAIADPRGRRVLVERVSAPAREEAPAREGDRPKRRPDRKPHSERGGAEGREAHTRQERTPRDGTERPARRSGEGRSFGDKPGGAGRSYAARSSERPRGAGGERGGDRPGGRPFGGKPGGGRPGGGKGPRPGGKRG